MKNKNMVLLLIAVGGFWYYKKKAANQSQASSLQSYGFDVDGLTPDHFGRPATIDGVSGILV